MKALVFHKPKHVSVDNVPDPEIKDPRDVILKVTSTAICGSDLHIYNGLIPQGKDMVLGHEFMGEVVETGSSVTKLKKGDRVVVPFPISCGHCFFCQMGEVTHCENSNDNYGPEGGFMTEKCAALFGYTDLYGGYDGGQAEYVRVPYADFGPRKVPGEFTDDQLLFLTDIFPTGWGAIDWAELKGGETVAIWGAGPVGIMAAKSAWVQGAGRVIILDIQQYRLDKAKAASNAETILVDDIDEAVKKIREMTQGRGADVCVDAVGMEADRNFLEKVNAAVHMQRGSMKVLEACFSSVRHAGTVTIVGVYGSPYDNFKMYQLFDKGLKLKMGQVPVHKYIDHLLDLVRDGKVVLDDVITHHLPLDEAAHGYDIFNSKKDNCTKIVLKP